MFFVGSWQNSVQELDDKEQRLVQLSREKVDSILSGYEKEQALLRWCFPGLNDFGILHM